jgi:Zn-dependent protease
MTSYASASVWETSNVQIKYTMLPQKDTCDDYVPCRRVILHLPAWPARSHLSGPVVFFQEREIMDTEYFILRIPAILIALTIHECAHALIALRLGDPTARDAGRISLNPLTHLDLLGTLMLFLGPFGWAKPVPVNINNLKNRQRDDIFVSLAGPFSNILLAVFFGYSMRLIEHFAPGIFSISYLYDFITLCIFLNIGLAFFNLLPVPPLDGSHVIGALLPPRQAYSYYRSMKYAPFFLLLLILGDRNLHFLNFLFIPFKNFWFWIIFWQ